MASVMKEAQISFYRSSTLVPQDSKHILVKFQCARIEVERFFELAGEERLGQYKDSFVQSRLISRQ